MSTENTENTINSAIEFKQLREKRELGDIIKLPSGLSVRAKRPSITKAISSGLVPSGSITKMITLQKSGTQNMKPEDIKAVMDVQRAIAPLALVEPRIVEKPDYENKEIHIDDLDEEDLVAIWTYVNGGQAGIELFLKERQLNNDVGLDSEKIPK